MVLFGVRIVVRLSGKGGKKGDFCSFTADGYILRKLFHPVRMFFRTIYSIFPIKPDILSPLRYLLITLLSLHGISAGV
jgi:hypothetical protein